jgi:hypothetical protein
MKEHTHIPKGYFPPLRMVAYRLTPLAFRFANKCQQVGQRLAQAVHRPRHHLLEVAAGHPFQEIVQAGATFALLGAADAFVCELGNDLVPKPLGGGAQLTQLIFGCLATSGNAGVDGYADNRNVRCKPSASAATAGYHAARCRAIGR